MAILLTACFQHPDIRRAMEYAEASEFNSQCRAFDHIVKFEEHPPVIGPTPYKPHTGYSQVGQWSKVPGRMTYGAYMRAANEMHPGEVCVIANADVWFPPDVFLPEFEKMKGWFLCVSRHIRNPNRAIGLLNSPSEWIVEPLNLCSQDAWIFSTPIEVPDGIEFTLGRRGCDNAIAARMKNAGFKVCNPAFDIRCYHHHDSKIFHHAGPGFENGEAVPPPYLNVVAGRLPPELR